MADSALSPAHAGNKSGAASTVRKLEIWLPIAGYPSYEVSNLGRVRGLRNRWGLLPVPRILKAMPANNGYPRVTLVERGCSPKYVNVHVLVCMAFHGPAPSPDHEVAHGDGNRTNCRWDNLRWATNGENHLDRKMHGRSGKKFAPPDVLVIRIRLADGESCRKIATSIGVAYSTINRIANGRTWGWLKT